MSDNQGMTFDAAPVKQDTPVQTPQAPDSSGMTFDAAPVKQDTPVQDQQPNTAPYDPKVHGRYTTAENYPAWLRTRPKAGANIKAGEDEAWMSAHTPSKTQLAIDSLTPIAMAAPVAATAIAAPEVIPAALKFAQSEAGRDLIKLVLKHTGEKLLTGAGIGVGYGAIHKAAQLLGLD